LADVQRRGVRRSQGAVMAKKRAAAAVACWCGSTAMNPFNQDYGVCTSCGGLVLTRADPPGRKPVDDDDKDFYGKKYWLQHQQGDLGNPDIHDRARGDLTERNLHWLAALLRYKLPGARAIELGSAHGSLVYLMQLAGFEASGTEMSPWVVDFGRRTFGITMQLGPVESLDIEGKSLDAVLMMDVLEHLPDPAGTLRRCMDLLKRGGIIVIQTPLYREGTSFAQMTASQDPFLEQLKPEEHLYLFSERGLRRLLREVGADHLAFEPAIFAHYDMFVVASRAKLKPHSVAAIESALLATPGGRGVLALLDLREREMKLLAERAKAQSDIAFLKDKAAAAGGGGEEATRLRMELAQLQKNFGTVEADRVARGEVIESQGLRVAALEGEVHEDLQRLAQAHDQVEALKNQRNLLEAEKADLRRNFDAMEADRVARGTVIEDQGRRVSALEAQIHGRLGELASAHVRMESLANERNLLEAQKADLQRNLEMVEKDRADRGRVIEEQGRTTADLHAQIDARLGELRALQDDIASLRKDLEISRAALASSRKELEDSQAALVSRGKDLEVSEAARIVSERDIQELDRRLADLERRAAEERKGFEARERALAELIDSLRGHLQDYQQELAAIKATPWYRAGRKLRIL